MGRTLMLVAALAFAGCASGPPAANLPADVGAWGTVGAALVLLVLVMAFIVGAVMLLRQGGNGRIVVDVPPSPVRELDTADIGEGRGPQ